MKKLMTMLAVFAMAGLMLLNACKDDTPTPLTIATLKVNDTDLNGATSATNISTSPVITATFSTDVDATSASATSVVLTRTYDNSTVATTTAVTGNTLTITPNSTLFAGDAYQLALTADLKSSKGEALPPTTVTFGTAGIGLGTAPQSAKQILYVQFGGDVIDLTGNNTKASAQVAWTADRFGNANGAAQFRGATGETPASGDIVEISGSKLTAPSMTLSVWFYIDEKDYVAPGNKPLLGLAAQNGYFIEIGDGDVNPGWMKFATRHLKDPAPTDGSSTTDTEWGDFGGNTDLTTNGAPVQMNTLTHTGWHHVAWTFDAATMTKTIYLDAQKVKTISTVDSGLKDVTVATGTGVDPKLALGFFAGKSNTADDFSNYSSNFRTFKGNMDDLRLFSVALSSTEISALYTAEKAQ